MFDKLKQLVGGVAEFNEEDAKRYRAAAKMRKLLMAIKQEATVLRNKILRICKESNPSVFKKKKDDK